MLEASELHRAMTNFLHDVRCVSEAQSGHRDAKRQEISLISQPCFIQAQLDCSECHSVTTSSPSITPPSSCSSGSSQTAYKFLLSLCANSNHLRPEARRPTTPGLQPASVERPNTAWNIPKTMGNICSSCCRGSTTRHYIVRHLLIISTRTNTRRSLR